MAALSRCKPQTIEIRDGCEFSEKSTKGVTKGEATTCLEALKGALDIELRKHVGNARVKGPRAHMFSVAVKPDVLFEVLDAWNETLQLQSNENKHGNTLRAAPEKEPAIKKRYATSGKLKSFVERRASETANHS